jgi:hypothetical protein
MRETMLDGCSYENVKSGGNDPRFSPHIDHIILIPPCDENVMRLKTERSFRDPAQSLGMQALDVEPFIGLLSDENNKTPLSCSRNRVSIISTWHHPYKKGSNWLLTD